MRLVYFGHNRKDATEVKRIQSFLDIGLTVTAFTFRRDLLKSLALSHSLKIRITLSGTISYFLIPDFDEQISSIPNMSYTGPYEWPVGLINAYQGADFVWAQDLSRAGGNSDWLIPNRVYEASYFGTLSIAVEETQTAKFVREHEIGYVLADDSAQTLISFFDNITLSEIHERRNRLLSIPASEFVATPADTTSLVERILKCSWQPEAATGSSSGAHSR